jgi:PAT family beta-lactamase induction signal transducer AmpG
MTNLSASSEKNSPPRQNKVPWHKILFSRKWSLYLFFGFTSGLPLLLIGGTLSAWMKDRQIDLATIGLFALVGMPYTLKFLWAPLMDRYTILPLGRRRGWMLASQLALAACLVWISAMDPARSTYMTALVALLIAFFSASQDIVIDAYRRDALSDEELGLGTSIHIAGYRLGMLVAGAVALILADKVSWPATYKIMAVCMSVGVVTTLLCKEPDTKASTPRSLSEAVVQPFVEYFKRNDSLVILAFILLYKVGPAMATTMTNPFYLELGFTKTQIGLVAKPVGLWTSIVGGLLGGVLMLRLGIKRSLFYFGLLQGVSTLLFAVLSFTGPSVSVLGLVIFAEVLADSLGTTAFSAFMLSVTNRKFSATQIALLTSLMGIPRVIFGASTGYLAKGLGWTGFFVFCTVIAAPGLLLLLRFRRWSMPEAARA